MAADSGGPDGVGVLKQASPTPDSSPAQRRPSKPSTQPVVATWSYCTSGVAKAVQQESIRSGVFSGAPGVVKAATVV